MKTPKTFTGYEIRIRSLGGRVTVVEMGDRYLVSLPAQYDADPVSLRRGSTDEDRVQADDRLARLMPSNATRELLDALGYAPVRPDTEMADASAAPEVDDVMTGDPAEVSLEQFRRINDYEQRLRSTGTRADQERLDAVRDRIDQILMANGFGVRSWRDALNLRDD